MAKLHYSTGLKHCTKLWFKSLHHRRTKKKYFSEYHAIGMPVVYIIAPTEVTEGRLYSEILSTLNAEYKERDTTAAKKKLVEHYFNSLNVEMLIIDRNTQHFRCFAT